MPTKNQDRPGSARHGWPVFPLVPGQKIPATPRGFKDATTDQAQIRAWWAAHPGRNIGIATGHPGPDVIDVDQHGNAGNGFAAWNRAGRAGLVDGPMAIVRTPSGGMHAYYAGTDQRSAAIASQHCQPDSRPPPARAAARAGGRRGGGGPAA